MKIRNGDLKAILPLRAPFVLGNDLAGTVVAVGARVTRFAVGDEVYAHPDQNRMGTFAELIAVHQDDVAIKPRALSMVEAASLPLVGLTAWQVLGGAGPHLRPGQKVLIHANHQQRRHRRHPTRETPRCERGHQKPVRPRPTW